MGKNNESSQYSIKISGEGITVEKGVDEDTARRVINIIMGGPFSGVRPSDIRHRRPSTDPRVSTESSYETSKIKEVSAGTVRKPSIREYLQEVNAKSNSEKILGIAGYLVEIKNLETINKEDIRGLFKKAGEPMPKNFPRDFSQVVKNAWISEDDATDGHFYLTKTGENTLRNNFSKDTLKPVRKSRKRKTKKVAAVNE